MIDHIDFFMGNAGYVLLVYSIITTIFIACFWSQLVYNAIDSIVLGGVLGLALFFFWLFYNHDVALLVTLIILSAILVLWVLKSKN